MVVEFCHVVPSHSFRSFLLLHSLDSALLEKLHDLDDGILNPAISTIIGTVLGAKDTTFAFVEPIVIKALSPFGLLKDKPEAESTVKPDGTTPVVAK